MGANIHLLFFNVEVTMQIKNSLLFINGGGQGLEKRWLWKWPRKEHISL